MKSIKGSLLRADLESLNDEFELDGLSGGLRYEVKHLVESEMNRVKSSVYKRLAVKKVKKSNSYAGK